MRIYFDTGAVVAAYVPEALSEIAADPIEAAVKVYISELTRVELLAALGLKLRTNELTRADAERVARTFSEHQADRAYTVVPIPAGAFHLAAKRLASFATSPRALDALHLTCCEHFELSLLTADQALAEAAVHLDLPHELLERPAGG